MLENEPVGTADAHADAAHSADTTTTDTPAKPATRRRRAASRPAGPATSEEVASSAGDEPAPVKRTRRTTKKAAAAPPEPDPAAAAAVEEPAAPASAAEEPAPAATKPRKRAKAAAAAPAVAKSADASAEPAEAAPPAKKTTSRRTTKKAAAAPAPEQAPVGSAPVEPAPVKSAEAASVAATTAEAAEAVETGVAPTTVAAPLVLFQPPTPVTTPRRRTRKAAAPEPSPEATADEQAAGRAEAGAETGADAATPAEELTAELTAAEATTEEPGADGEAGEGTSEDEGRRRRRRRGGRGRRRRNGDAHDGEHDHDEHDGDQEHVDHEHAEHAEHDEHGDEGAETHDEHADEPNGEGEGGTRRRRRRRRRGSNGGDEGSPDDPVHTVTRVREPRSRDRDRDRDGEVTSLRGSTRLEAKKQRRREGREAGRRRPPVITEAEFLARREAVNRIMVTRQIGDRTQIAVLEDGVLVEHYINRETNTSYVGNVYLGRVQNVLPSMEAAFVDIGKGRNAVLYAGEVNWDAAGLEGQPKRIEQALKSGDTVLVQVTKDPIGHKGARLTSQISLPGRYLVYVPRNSMTGISRKLPDTERARLKKILKKVVPDDAGVIVRTAAEGASEEELARDVARLQAQWSDIEAKASSGASGPTLLYSEPDLAVRVIRDVFNEDFTEVVVSGDEAWDTISAYVGHVAPDLAERLRRWTADEDVFAHYRVDEQLAKALDRKVWLPSGGSLIIDRTEAMVVIDVNTGKFTGKGGNLEETVTKNNLEAAEEIVRQLRLRDLGGIIVVDFIDMVLESNRELVMRRLVECLGRDRTRHQVAEVTSLGLVQMTRKRIGQGLLEAFSTPCEACNGRGVKVSMEPVGHRRSGGRKAAAPVPVPVPGSVPTPAAIAAHAPVPTPAAIPTPVLAPAPVPTPAPAAAPEPAAAADSAPADSAPADSASAASASTVTSPAASPEPEPAAPASVPTFAPRGVDLPDLHDAESAYPARRRGRRRATAPAGAPRSAAGTATDETAHSDGPQPVGGDAHEG